MRVIVNKNALQEAIENMLTEDRSIRSTRIDTIAGDVDVDTDDEPIVPSELMSTQFVVDRPPVEDPAFIPASIEELSRAASVIAGVVPQEEIEFFYRKIHKLLDATLDRHEAVAEEEALPNLAAWSPVGMANESMSYRSAKRLLNEEDFTEDEIDANKEAVNSILILLELYQVGYSDDQRELKFGFYGREPGEKFRVPLTKPEVEKELNTFIGPTSVNESVEKVLGDLPKDSREWVLNQVRYEFLKRFSEEASVADRDQANVNQLVAKELDDLLPVKTYDEIIEFYNEKISKESDEKKRVAYQDMIEIIRVRMRDPGKRERTDLSSKELKKEKKWGAEIDQMPEVSDEEAERLKALDSMAPFFGFKNASGIRQWRRKYADPKFKALLGSEVGKPEYLKYFDRIMDNMGALLEEFADISEKIISGMEKELSKNPDDSELKEMKSSMSHIDKQLQEMVKASLEDESGYIPSDLLINTAAGAILRNAFAEAYFDNQFRNFANGMKKHMTSFLQSQDVDSKGASTFAKMFNGEVDIIDKKDLKDPQSKKGQKMVNLGITPEIYDSAVKEHEKFSESFFTGDYQKQSEKKFMTLLRDKKALGKLFDNAITTSQEDVDREEKMRRAQSDTKEKLAESYVRKIIRNLERRK